MGQEWGRNGLGLLRNFRNEPGVHQDWWGSVKCCPRPPPGCVSEVSIFGQPCSEGKYCDMNKIHRPQPMWIYNSLKPWPADVGREALTPRLEKLPSLRDPPRPPSDYDSNSNDHHYPDFDYKDQPMKEVEAENLELMKSVMIPPAALDRQIFRMTVSQNQIFWFETGSINQARQLRNYMHHWQESGVELLVTFGNYKNYLRALRQSQYFPFLHWFRPEYTGIRLK